MKITLLSHEYPPFFRGGVGTFCHDLGEALSERNIDTVIIAGKSDIPTIEKINNNLKIVRLPCYDFPPRHFWFYIKNLSRKINLLKETSIFHCIKPEDAMLCSVYKNKLRKPMITSIHGIPHSDLREFLRSPFRTWNMGEFAYNFVEFPLNERFFMKALRDSDHLLTCSYSTLNEVNKIYTNINSENTSVIYNSINFHRFDKINATTNQKYAENQENAFGKNLQMHIKNKNKRKSIA